MTVTMQAARSGVPKQQWSDLFFFNCFLFQNSFESSVSFLFQLIQENNNFVSMVCFFLPTIYLNLVRMFVCVSKCSLYTFYNNPALLNGSTKFHYCTDSNPGTGADNTFVLKRGVWCNATWPLHSRPAIATSARHFQICLSLSILTACLFTYSLFT